MKYIFNKLILFAAVLFATHTAFAGNDGFYLTESTTMKQDTVQKPEIVRYEVFGMDCPGCQSALEKQVKKIEGVADAKASFKDKEVVVYVKPGENVEDEEIKDRIKKANFTPGKKVEPAQNEEK